MSVTLAVMAAVVAAAYFTIGALIVPRIHVSGASRRFTLAFRVGAVSFFVGCGLSHLHIAIHAITEPGQVEAHQLAFHVLQVVGGWAFIIAAVKLLDISVSRRLPPEERELGELQEMALRDPLTGAYNRRYFDEVIEQELARGRRSGHGPSVLLIDVDEFKRINDVAGHHAGDEVLATVAELFTREVRPSDTVARLGGDEFCVLLPETESLRAMSVAERLRAAVRRHEFAGGRRVTISVGIATVPEDGDDPRTVIAAADRAMYWAKSSGRDLAALATERRDGDGDPAPGASREPAGASGSANPRDP